MKVKKNELGSHFSGRTLKTAVAAAAALLLPFSPLMESRAHAQDAPKTAVSSQPAPAATDAPPIPLPPLPSTPSESTQQGSESDLMINGNRDQIDLTGRRRDVTLNNNWDLGGNVLSNEAGSAIWASAKYKRLVSLDAGNIWFGPQAVPFATLSVKPVVNFGNFKFFYYGRASAMDNMTSILYTSHAIGFGLSQPLDKNGDWRLRIGFVTDLALSYPNFDNFFSSISAGASLQYKNWLFYSMPTFFWAADTPTKTSYFFGNYYPHIQGAESGIQMTIKDYTARIFLDYTTLKQTGGARVTRSFSISNEVAGDVWVGGGLNHWIEELGGSNNMSIMAGATIIFGGRYVNSTNTVRYEHIQAGGVPAAKIDIPTQQNPGPYGFGRSGNAYWDGIADSTNQALMTSGGNFSSFSSSFKGQSEDDIIARARYMLAFIQQVGYASGAQDALKGAKILDPSLRALASETLDSQTNVFGQLVQFYQTHNPSDPLPPALKAGYYVCAQAADYVMHFMDNNGVRSIVAQVATRDGMHMVPLAIPGDKTVLLDWGNAITTPAGTFDQTLRLYGQQKGAPTLVSQIFDPRGYLGSYYTPEARLLNEATGTYAPSLLKTEILGVK